MSIDGHQYNLIKMELKNVVSLDFDFKEDRIYYADVGNKTINRIFVNGTGEQVVIRHEAHGLEGKFELLKFVYRSVFIKH